MANFEPPIARQPHSPDVAHLLQIQPKGHRKSHNKIGALSLVERTVGFKPGALNALTHCALPKKV